MHAACLYLNGNYQEAVNLLKTTSFYEPSFYGYPSEIINAINNKDDNYVKNWNPENYDSIENMIFNRVEIDTALKQIYQK